MPWAALSQLRICSWDFFFNLNTFEQKYNFGFFLLFKYARTFLKKKKSIKTEGGGLHVLSWDRSAPGIAIFLLLL